MLHPKIICRVSFFLSCQRTISKKNDLLLHFPRGLAVIKKAVDNLRFDCETGLKRQWILLLFCWQVCQSWWHHRRIHKQPISHKHALFCHYFDFSELLWSNLRGKEDFIFMKLYAGIGVRTELEHFLRVRV